jgi:hypothetical protein
VKKQGREEIGTKENIRNLELLIMGKKRQL